MHWEDWSRVDEPDAVGNLGGTTAPVQPTNYAYNALDKLIQTSQTGVPNGGSSPVTQIRTFTFSSLGRLISANNPESGLIWHEYDANGNLKKKTDARNVFIDYTYDELNRNRTVDYSDTAVKPDITRVYDNPAAGDYGKGKFWKDYAGGDDNNGPNVEYRKKLTVTTRSDVRFRFCASSRTTASGAQRSPHRKFMTWRGTSRPRTIRQAGASPTPMTSPEI